MVVSSPTAGLHDLWLASRDSLIASVHPDRMRSDPLHHQGSESVQAPLTDSVELSRVVPAPSEARDLDQQNQESQTPGKELTEEEEKEVEELRKRDLEVRQHEQAHFRAAGNYASPPRYEFETGPDGKRYAVGGSVQIDTSEIPGDPQATLQKARIVKRAALAPEEPSAQDRKVARKAEQMAMRARQDLAEQQGKQVSQSGEAPAPVQPTNTESVEPEVAVQAERAKLEVPTGFPKNNVYRYQVTQLEMATLMSPAEKQNDVFATLYNGLKAENYTLFDAMA